MTQNIWSDQIILVTGGAGSIGSAVVDTFLQLGARVSCADGQALMRQDHRFRSDIVDVANSLQVKDWVTSVASGWGTPTVGVVCAGISRPGHLATLSDQEWQDVIDVNLSGAFYCMREIVRQMVDAGQGGRLVAVGSWAAHAPHPHIGAYSASKAGLRMLCQTMALDHAKDGILINEVAPGLVNAGLSRELFDKDPALKARTIDAIPSARLLEPADVARDVAFLASPLNRHTTGTVLVSDGGIGLSNVMNPGR